MKIKELREDINALCEYGHITGEEEVRITLSEPSMGARASCGVSFIGQGMDWEHGEIRISPSEEIIRKQKNRDIPIPVIEHIYEYKESGKKTISSRCPVCDGEVRKGMRFCPSCGQAIINPDKLRFRLRVPISDSKIKSFQKSDTLEVKKLFDMLSHLKELELKRTTCGMVACKSKTILYYRDEKKLRCTLDLTAFIDKLSVKEDALRKIIIVEDIL